ncbi:hypothetical protein [Roseibium sp.]|uniref:hypothetical protein n=3 Tax=Roseibium sp. TaxID=1936156 RepID=UPI00326761C2
MSVPAADPALTFRVLGPEDADLAAATGLSGFTVAELLSELQRPRDYVWAALFCDLRPVALHRSMRWGDFLLFKGLYVLDDFLGTPAGLRLALLLRNYARTAGYRGIAVWIESGKPERAIAARLRVSQSGPILHRFLLPLPPSSDAPGTLPEACSGRIEVACSGPPLVADLLTGTESPEPHVNWVLDRGLLVLGGAPCTSIGQLPDLTGGLAALGHSLGAQAIELPLPASDLFAMFALTSTGAQRLSRTPVRLGLHRFDRQAGLSLDGGAGAQTKDIAEAAHAG